MNKFPDHKIGSHDSATGESGDGLLSWLLTPFARCQSKTIREQWEAGCRLFDLRARTDEAGILRLAHGLWVAKRSLASILEELDQIAYEDCWIGLTWEGRSESEEEDKMWIDLASYMLEGRTRNLKLAWIAVKKPVWRTLKIGSGYPGHVQVFHGISPEHWWTMLLPVPRFWKQVWTYKKDVPAEKFVVDDFI